jgi:hypothetical protein
MDRIYPPTPLYPREAIVEKLLCSSFDEVDLSLTSSSFYSPLLSFSCCSTACRFHPPSPALSTAPQPLLPSLFRLSASPNSPTTNQDCCTSRRKQSEHSYNAYSEWPGLQGGEGSRLAFKWGNRAGGTANQGRRSMRKASNQSEDNRRGHRCSEPLFRRRNGTFPFFESKPAERRRAATTRRRVMKRARGRRADASHHCIARRSQIDVSSSFTGFLRGFFRASCLSRPLKTQLDPLL